MPVETLKIDRAFMREVPEQPRGVRDRHRDPAACRRALGRVAVAEGVETEEQRRFLADEGCPLAQGFLLARPLPAPRASKQLLAAAASASLAEARRMRDRGAVLQAALA